MMLLEVMIALAILAIVGAAYLGMTANALSTVRRAGEHERRVRDASAFLAAVSLWTRVDLDRRLGARRQGPWMLVIDRPTPRLYSVAVTDTATNEIIVATTLFRDAVLR